ncbi:MAG TPA: hypothetical protein VLS90_12095, partial [Thermodesulfobacteriota bacterium]|nr:hypothetical protein [Thermodesulfobacteriota bacterium]
ALIKLRFSDPYSPRPYHVPLNVEIDYKGRRVKFPVLGVIGLLGVGLILFEVILTHEIGRIAGPAWIALTFLYYVWYRRTMKMPVFGSLRRDWEREQKAVLESAEEFDLLEHYLLALSERDKAKRKKPAKGIERTG